MKMDRNKLLAIALGANISACATPKLPDAQPAQQELTSPRANTATPSLVNTPPNSTKTEGSKPKNLAQHSPTEACLEQNEDGECAARDPYEDDEETYIPLETLDGDFEMCVEYAPSDECIKWEWVADCIEVDEDDKCVTRHPS